MTTIGWSGSRDEAAQGLIELAPTFEVRPEAAAGILREIRTAVTGWQAAASSNGITAAQVCRFARAFRTPSALESA